jgi:signal peptidase
VGQDKEKMLIKPVRMFVTAILVMMTAVAMLTILVPRLAGWSTFVVTSGSMRPTLNPGDLVVSSPTQPDQIGAGDILTFRTPGGLTTHRVIKKVRAENAGVSQFAFSTKGDANEDADPASLSPRNIVGRARFGVPYVGFAVSFVQTPFGST